jgi:hypothetical protein
MSEGYSPISPPRKLQRLRFQVLDGNGKFKCVNPLSSDFISQFCIYRQKFHESLPSGSKNDYGWYRELEKQWSDWRKDGRADIEVIPTKSILNKIYAAKKSRPMESNFFTPTVATAASKLYLFLSILCNDDSPFFVTMTLIM